MLRVFRRFRQIYFVMNKIGYVFKQKIDAWVWLAGESSSAREGRPQQSLRILRQNPSHRQRENSYDIFSILRFRVSTGWNHFRTRFRYEFLHFHIKFCFKIWKVPRRVRFAAARWSLRRRTKLSRRPRTFWARLSRYVFFWNLCHICTWNRYFERF